MSNTADLVRLVGDLKHMVAEATGYQYINIAVNKDLATDTWQVIWPRRGLASHGRVPGSLRWDYSDLITHRIERTRLTDITEDDIKLLLVKAKLTTCR